MREIAIGGEVRFRGVDIENRGLTRLHPIYWFRASIIFVSLSLLLARVRSFVA